MAKVSGYISVEGLRAALRSLPGEASAKLRDAAQSIAGDVATRASSRASSVGGVAKYVAPTIKASRDRVPVVRMGGSSRLPTSGSGWTSARTGSRQTVGDIIWGAEYGGGARPTTRQFMPWRGTQGGGYFLWPAYREMGAEVGERYSQALLRALEAI